MPTIFETLASVNIDVERQLILEIDISSTSLELLEEGLTVGFLDASRPGAVLGNLRFV